ncbi:flagellar hook-length control protein FliK [Nitrosovibrio sp. Nv6]|uniref:flagellar hook-length control protein FliK n=1 Tax=Nitrosovibrio sp. Nv6 TaxID=1855340 RepID=UPI0008B54D45|nr:flagellar hook-length control protein FliK [Nitrosovibrio sp. Nv6]SEO48956.1 flagellar hook-length control protein FliK [Nitrosovibrio sp. Nv6]
MLTSPMLPNSTSSPVSQIKKSGLASDAADTGGAGQAVGFSEVLEHEINGKGDVPGIRSADGNAAQAKTSNDMAMRTGQIAGRNAEIQKDGKDTETSMAAAIMASPSIALANGLPEPASGYSPEASIGNHVDASDHALTDASANLTPEVPQAELAATVAQQAGVAALQPGLAAEAGAGAESSAQAGVRAAASGATPRTAQLSATVLSEISTETSVDVLAAEMVTNAAGTVTTAKQAEAARAIIGDDAPIGTGPAAAQGASPRLQSSLPEFSLREVNWITEGEKSAQFLTDASHQSLPPAQTEAMMTAIAIERGSASAISTVAADAPAHAAAALGLEPRLGAPGWDNALGQKVLWMVSQQQQVAELNLNPPGLGPLQVVLSVTGDQASATFVSQQPEVRQALEAALPRLKEMMADSGINLGSTTVSSESPQQQREFDRQGRPGARYDGVGLGTAQGNDMGVSHIRSAGNSLVDTFA